MLTFKAFITEEPSQRTVPISEERAFSLIDENCQAFAKKMRTMQIFRGGSATHGKPGSCYFGNSNAGRERKSANTANYFTWWHDNHPDWADFPKRSRSFICSNDYDIANAYGNVLLLIPFDTAHIGVIPTHDLFVAIKGPTGETLDTENYYTGKFLSRVQKQYGLSNPESYDDFVEQLKLATKKLIDSMDNDYTKEHLMRNMKFFSAASYYDVIRKMFNPKGFKQDTASQIELPKKDVEIYVQGNAVLIPYLQTTTEEFDELFAKASEKYGWNENPNL